MKYALFVRTKGSRNVIIEELSDYQKSTLLSDRDLDFLGYIKGQSLSFIKDTSTYTIETSKSYLLNKKKG